VGALARSEGAAGVDHPLALQLLVDFVAGAVADGGEVRGAGRIVRVVVAGNLVGNVGTGDRDGRTAASSGGGGGGGGGGGAASAVSAVSAASGASSAATVMARGGRGLDRDMSLGAQDAAVDALRDADAAVAALAACVPVDVMPGDGDPASFTLPQQPLHPVLLPQAARFSTLRTVPNPYDAEVGGVRFLGTSGQPVADIRRYASEVTVMTPGDELGLRAAHRAWLSGSGSDAASSAAAGGGAAGSGSHGGGGGSSSSGGHLRMTTGDDEADADAAPPELAAAVSSTARDKSMAAITGSGGAGGMDHRSETVAEMREVDVLTNCLYWRHLAPTCPDTLASYPFYELDPYVLDCAYLPHVLFSGGSRAFGTRWVGTRIIAVPDFAATATAVLVNTASPTLEVQPVRFAVGAGAW